MSNNQIGMNHSKIHVREGCEVIHLGKITFLREASSPLEMIGFSLIEIARYGKLCIFHEPAVIPAPPTPVYI
jgi:hypothetical protein